MDIKWYVFGVPTTCGANFYGAHHFSWTKSPSPRSQLVALTHNWLSRGRAQWLIEGYVLGSLPLVRASFGMPTTSVGPRVLPSSLPLAPLAPSHSLSPQSHSPHSLSLPMANIGKGYVILCLGVPITSVGAKGSEGSETNVILGFKAPTISGGKKLWW